MRLIATFFCTLIVSTSSADIYQWYDGDGDGSLWLSNNEVAPWSNLSSQTLWWADLELGNLHHSNLAFANLMYAQMSNSNLSNSNLSYVNLYGASLDNVDFAFTVLAGAGLQTADISGANLFYADLSDTNLSNLQNWQNAFWLAARYTDNTVFPDGMNPENYGMILLEIPTPGSICLFGVVILLKRRRR